jgi:type IV pilus assembly protein PilV
MTFDQQRGFTLIEFLVTLVLVAIGLLGVAAIQARTGATQTDSVERKLAAAASIALAERMRANHLGALNGNYQTSLAPGAPLQLSPVGCATSICTPAEIAQIDIESWLLELRNSLPGSGALVAPQAAGTNVVIAWLEPDNGVNGDNTGNSSDPAAMTLNCAAMNINDPAVRCLTVLVSNP